jgi:hypothetical protein
LVAGLSVPLLPEAGGETAALNAQDRVWGLRPGSPPPA